MQQTRDRWALHSALRNAALDLRSAAGQRPGLPTIAARRAHLRTRPPTQSHCRHHHTTSPPPLPPCLPAPPGDGLHPNAGGQDVLLGCVRAGVQAYLFPPDPALG